MQLTAFSMGNVACARKLWRIMHFYFDVKPRTETVDRKSLCLLVSSHWEMSMHSYLKVQVCHWCMVPLGTSNSAFTIKPDGDILIILGGIKINAEE